MIRKILILSVALFLATVALADEKTDSAFLALYHRYYQLYYTDSVKEFHEVSHKVQQHYKEKGKMEYYYKIRQNEIFYDADRAGAYDAIKKANAFLEEMKNSETKHYELAYMSLGFIFEGRGNYRIARYYYQEALDNIDPVDSMGLAHLYSQMAGINVTRETDRAREWIERLGKVISRDSLYYKGYLTMKGEYYFFKEDRDNFFKNKRQLDSYVKRHPSLDGSGDQIMKIMEKAFLGKYDEAQSLLDEESQDYDDIRRCNIRVQIYKMMGRGDLALKVVDKRRDIRDSLSNDLLFNSLNEINANINYAKLSEKTTKEHATALNSVIALLAIAFGLIAFRYYSGRRSQKKLLEQNEHLEMAFKEVKESERMKSEFIKHISHEIRTPLNGIVGFTQVLANPNVQLDREGRKSMLQAINKNTASIINIANDLLEMSQGDSASRYSKNDKIAINDLCRSIMEKAEGNNIKKLELIFKTNLPHDFIVQSNEEGVERVLQQLMDNALKFTEKGSVELSVSKSKDGSKLKFAITDTGIGIPEERQEQVFEQFYKVDNFTQGLGIGLSVIRKIAIYLGGNLVIDKGYHDGTRMVFTLPVK